MTKALYNKWRPQRWDEVVGQQHITQTLRNAVTGGRVAHAYLFAGPRGTGKTTVARLLAKAVNWKRPSSCGRRPHYSLGILPSFPRRCPGAPAPLEQQRSRGSAFS